jgi:hypothetical protein
MRCKFNVVLVGALALFPLLSEPAQSQTPTKAPKGPAQAPAQASSDQFTSALGCPKPSEAKEAKVIDFDAGTSMARLAVNLGSGRFKVVTIKTWDRQEDPRPLVPVVEAAKIMQGKVQLYTPDLNSDPQSAANSFILMTEMGGEHVCWATPSSLLKEGAYPVADSAQSAATPAPTRAQTDAVTPAPKLAQADGAPKLENAPEIVVRTPMGRRLERERNQTPAR